MEYFQKNPYKYCKEKTKAILSELGIGLSEYVYKRAFEVELKNDGIPYESEKNILIFYKGMQVGYLRADVVINGNFLIEFKTINQIRIPEKIQLRNYMRFLKVKKGIIINFRKPIFSDQVMPEYYIK